MAEFLDFGLPQETAEEQEPRKRPLETAEGEPISRGALKRQTVDSDFMLKMLVPMNAAGQLIGKKGATIVALQESSGAKIKLSQNAEYFPGTNERVASVAGNVEQLLAGCNLVMEKINEITFEQPRPAGEDPFAPPLERQITVKVLIDSTWAGRLIGKGGAAINTIMQESNARIHISQNNEVPRGVNERIAIIRGIPQHCQQAVTKIITKMCEEPEVFVYANQSTSYHHQRQPAHDPMSDRRTFNAMPYQEPPMMSTIGGFGPMMGPQTTITMQVSDQHVGAILGRGGSTIAELQVASGAQIKVSQKREGGKRQNSVRTITITGPSHATQTAQFLITQKLTIAMQSASMSNGAPPPPTPAAPGVVPGGANRFYSQSPSRF